MQTKESKRVAALKYYYKHKNSEKYKAGVLSRKENIKKSHSKYYQKNKETILFKKRMKNVPVYYINKNNIINPHVLD